MAANSDCYWNSHFLPSPKKNDTGPAGGLSGSTGISKASASAIQYYILLEMGSATSRFRAPDGSLSPLQRPTLSTPHLHSYGDSFDKRHLIRVRVPREPIRLRGCPSIALLYLHLPQVGSQTSEPWDPVKFNWH